MIPFIKNIRRFREPGNELTLDLQIFNELLIILGFLSFVTGFRSLTVSLPAFSSGMFFVSSIIALVLFVLNQYKKCYSISKIFFLVIIYSLAVVAWRYNGGLNGSGALFLIAINIYTLAIFKNRHLLLAVINISFFTAVCLMNHLYPETLLVSYRNETDRVIDLIVSYTLLTSSIALVINSILKNYNKVNMKTTSQKEELEKLNIEITRANNELKKLNASKDKFLSIIAHDLRSPVATIQGYSDYLLSHPGSPHDEHSRLFMKNINSAARKTLELLDNLLTWSRSQSGHIFFNPSRTGLAGVIGEVTETLRPTARFKNIAVTFSGSDDINLVADRNMLKIILQNIISNAIKFTLPGGKVEISARCLDDRVEISVSDTGLGMSDSIKMSLFDPDAHVTTAGTEKETGSGLGLLISKEFIDKHGGNISVTSELNKGSRFTIALPKYQGYNMSSPCINEPVECDKIRMARAK
jgi:signal transduction histidine kinase